MTHVLGMLPGSTFKPLKTPRTRLRTLGPQLCGSKRVRRAVGQKLLGQRFEWRVLDIRIIAFRGPDLGSALGSPFWGRLIQSLLQGPKVGPKCDPRFGPQIRSQNVFLRALTVA